MRINVLKSYLSLTFLLIILSSCFSLFGNGSNTTSVKSTESALRKDIVNYGEKYVGTKYKYAGKVPSTGFDCSGFTSYVMRNFDITVSSSSRAQAKEGKKISVSQAKEGDIVVFGKGGRINHVGLVVSNGSEGLRIIHSTSRGVVIDNVSNSKYWKPRIMYAVDVVSR